MRILWLSHLLPFPPKGGVQQRSYNLMRELAKHHEVHLLSFFQKAHQHSLRAVDDAIREFSRFVQVHGYCAIPSDYALFGRERLAARALLTRTPFNMLWLQSKEFGSLLKEISTRLQPELVHYDTIGLAQYRRYFPHIASALTHHNIESDMLLRRASNEKNKLKSAFFSYEGRLVREAERQLGAQFDLHVCCSEVDAIKLRGILPTAETFVAPNGADLEYFKPTPNTEPVPDSLVFAGGLSWYPNASAMRFFFEDVWPLLTKEHPPTSITVVGKHPPHWLQRHASEDSRVTVTGFVDDVRPYLSRAMVYVCPIFDGGGTKLKMVDALAMGKAIVAHPVACEGLELVDGEDVLMATTPEDFTRCIRRLFVDTNLRKRLEHNARKVAEKNYSFTAIGQSLARRYQSLVSEPKKSNKTSQT